MVKLSEKFELLAYEIKILRKIAKKYIGTSEQLHVPEIEDYGMVVLTNMYKKEDKWGDKT